jgi:forespore regulator of the sigma-K checkpoint
VSRFRILKELKKSIKRKRRHVLSLGAGVVFFLLAALVGSWFAHRVITLSLSESKVYLYDDSVPVWMDNLTVVEEPDWTMREKTLHMLQSRVDEVEVILHRTYLCGEETRQLGKQSSSVAAELLKSHREWGAEFDSIGRLLMEQTVDDLSPQCRKTAYIGMDKNGNLSLYDGPPRREKVIRTFFQLDVDRLETRMNEDRVFELSNGIRVSDKDEYNSVLSTFNEFARLKSQVDLQPTD